MNSKKLLESNDTLTIISFFDIKGERTLIEEIEFKNRTIPDSLSFQYSYSYEENQVLGRFSPLHVYSGSAGKTISFSITIHEDWLADKYKKNIITFVDAVKSLSYPRLFNGVLMFPKVYLQIGELYLIGVVETSISWKLPIREGRFILADISFTFRAEKEFKEVKVRGTKVEVKGLDVDESRYFASDKVVAENYIDLYYYIYNLSEQSGYSATETLEKLKQNPSLFGSYNTEDFKTILEETSYTLLKSETERLEKLYTTLNKDSTLSSMNKLINLYKDSGYKDLLGTLTKDTEEGSFLSIPLTDKSYISKINKTEIIRDLEEFLDGYIAANLSGTFEGDEEKAKAYKEKVKKEALDILLNIFEIWKGTIGYGSGS